MRHSWKEFRPCYSVMDADVAYVRRLYTPAWLVKHEMPQFFFIVLFSRISRNLTSNGQVSSRLLNETCVRFKGRVKECLKGERSGWTGQYSSRSF